HNCLKLINKDFLLFKSFLTEYETSVFCVLLVLLLLQSNKLNNVFINSFSCVMALQYSLTKYEVSIFNKYTPNVRSRIPWLQDIIFFSLTENINFPSLINISLLQICESLFMTELTLQSTVINAFEG
ncbi:hypothetical protein L9F63_018200, partial [Diploptera punctata]